MKIMLVDDNEKVRLLIKKILKENFEIIEQIWECSSGEEAIALYQRYKPDIVLMDIQLKQMDGLTATKLILAANVTANVLIITQYDDPAYQEAAKQAGARAFILKDNLLGIPDLIKKCLKES